jgi:hypothetical protein
MTQPSQKTPRRTSPSRPLLILTLISLLASPLLSATALETDYSYCKENFANRSGFVSTSYNDPDNTPTYTLTQGSNVIRYFLRSNVSEYLSVNLVSLIPWILLASIAILGWICCTSILLVNLIRKNRYVLTPMEKKRIDMEDKKTKKKEEKQKIKDDKKKEKENAEDDDDVSGEEEEDEEDNFTDVEDDPVKLMELSKTKNHPDFRRKENFI